MRGAAALLGALFLLSSCPDAGAAADRAPGSFEAGRRAFESGDFASALAAFEAARAAGMREPAVLYNIGVCRYRLGDYAGAERAFVELAARHPAMAPLADYNVGLARYRQRDRPGAATAFRRAAAGPDPKIAALAARMLERVAPAPVTVAAPPWSAFIDLAFGFDDNVALVDEAGLAAGDSTDSPFAAFFGQLGRAPAERGFGGTLSAYLVRYPDAGQFDQDIVQLAGAWAFAATDWNVELGPHVSLSTLDGDRFERRLGARIAADRAVDAATRFEARLVFETIDELDDRFAFVDGSRGLLELELERRAGQGHLGVEYGFSVEDRADASVSPTRHRLALRYRRPLRGPWSLAAGGAFRASRHDDLPERRDEERTELSLALYRELPEDWQLALEYRYTSNTSSVDAFDYDRNRARLGINRVFQ